jgi:biotin operon repressor
LNRGPPHSKDFARARLQAADELRRDGKLSAAARLVGLEIFSYVNQASGEAFPSEATIARRLGITDRTVRTAVKQLADAGRIKVTRRRGRNNLYSPAFIKQTQEKISGVGTPRSSGTPEKFDADPGKKQQGTPEKNDPLTLLLNPMRTLRGSLATAPPTGALRSPQAQARQKTENEIAEALGWQCFMAMPTAEAEDLRKRWPNVEKAELLELKGKYNQGSSTLRASAQAGDAGSSPAPVAKPDRTTMVLDIVTAQLNELESRRRRAAA